MTSTTITQAQARSELDRRATPKNQAERWMLPATHIKQATNEALRAKAGEYTPVARPVGWKAKGAARKATTTSIPKTAQVPGSPDGKTAFKQAYDTASKSKQYAGKLAMGYVLGQGMSVTDAVAKAVAKAEAYVRVADRVNV